MTGHAINCEFPTAVRSGISEVIPKVIQINSRRRGSAFDVYPLLITVCCADAEVLEITPMRYPLGVVNK
ncbi:hypothetical protein D3C85_965100 [compost metagenome]